jgi:hypothetical protein
MDSLKFHSAPPSPTLLRPAGRSPSNGLMAVWGVACPQGVQPAAVFFPLDTPFLYGPGQ